MPPFPFRTCFHYPCFHKAWNTKRAVLREDSPVLQGITVVYMQHLFHFPILLPVESEYQATEDAEKYRRRYQKAGDFIEEPEESPETDDGDCRPYR